MSEIKVGDKIKVTELLFLDKANGIVEGETYEVVETRIDGNGVFVNTPNKNNVGLIYEQIEKVEEEKQVNKFKVGDKVRVTGLVKHVDAAMGIRVGDVLKVNEIRYDGALLVSVGDNDKHPMLTHQVELVEEEERVSEFKIGDKVQVKWVDEEDKCNDISKGDCFNVLRVDSDGDIGVALPNGEKGVLFKGQLEKVENKTEFTFPEMAQKLIDGEFEKGTELVTNNGSTYFVDRVFCKHTYGLKSIKDGAFVVSKISASDFNATWKVKEQPIKEMSIAEIQKELGYKIKVTE